MHHYDLNDDNFMFLAIKAYDKPNVCTFEFSEDFKRIKYIKRLIGKYKQSGDIKERLILNHIIVLANVFGVEFTTRMLFYKLDGGHHSVLKTFLVYLKYIPENHSIHTINGSVMHINDVELDLNIADKLRRI
jgi:hypothetical protein